jgi:hypothetical protein
MEIASEEVHTSIVKPISGWKRSNIASLPKIWTVVSIIDYYINIEQMINQIKFKSVSMKKDVKIILTAKFLVDIENMFKIQHD